MVQVDVIVSDRSRPRVKFFVIVRVRPRPKVRVSVMVRGRGSIISSVWPRVLFIVRVLLPLELGLKCGAQV
jgi:hypothetical protein